MTEAIAFGGSWLYKMVFTLIIGAIVITCVGVVTRGEVNAIEVQHAMFVNRVLYTPYGFWYKDADGMTHPGVIDKSRYTQQVVDDAFQYLDNYGGARLQLESGSGVDLGTVYINKPSFQAMWPTSQTVKQRASTNEVRVYPVAIRDGSATSWGTLTVYVVMPSFA